MRLNKVLCAQHLGRFYKKHWRIQGLKRIEETAAFKILGEKNIPIYEPDDILKEKREIEKVEVIGYIPEPVKYDNTHPNWHDRVCLKYRDRNVLVEGLIQAKSLIKTVEIRNGLPDDFKLVNTSKIIDERVKDIIFFSHVYDAEEEKLPKVKDPERPAWNFPRTYGITERRRNLLMTSKLIQLVENLNPNAALQRFVLDDVNFTYTFEKHNDLIQFDLRGDSFITARKPLDPVTDSNGTDVDLPQLTPVSDIITLERDNIYVVKNTYPINTTKFKKSHPHTLFVHYNGTEVSNIYEKDVEEEQIHGRTLLKAFTAAATYAKQKYGENIGALPKPVTLQCVHLDGRLFHFGILQLNTLDMNHRDSIKNIWFQTDRLPLFNECCYHKGRPKLEGYNSDVIRHLIGFYNNV